MNKYEENRAHLSFNQEELRLLYDMVEFILQNNYNEFLKGAPPITHRHFGQVYSKVEKSLKKLFKIVD